MDSKVYVISLYHFQIDNCENKANKAADGLCCFFFQETRAKNKIFKLKTLVFCISCGLYQLKQIF